MARMKDYALYWRNPATRQFEKVAEKYHTRLMVIDGIPNEIRGVNFLASRRREQYTGRLVIPGGDQAERTGA